MDHRAVSGAARREITDACQPLIAFKKQNRLCRNINVWRAEALEKGWLVPREENHIVIFVSSRWWGDGTPDFEEPHASAQQKHVQIFKAASRLAKRLDIDRTRVYLWLGKPRHSPANSRRPASRV